MPNQKELNVHPLQKWIEEEELENVMSLKKQLSYSQCEKLVAAFSKQEIADTLLEMENHKPLKKKYRSVYLTLRQWIKLKRDRAPSPSGGSGGLFTYQEALTWMQKQGVEPDHNQHFEAVKKNGKIYWKKR